MIIKKTSIHYKLSYKNNKFNLKGTYEIYYTVIMKNNKKLLLQHKNNFKIIKHLYL